MDDTSMEMNETGTDVLVIGGGAAGLWAAIRAKDFCPRVTVVDKGKVASSGASAFTHSIVAPVAKRDIPAMMEQLVNDGQYMCDQKLLEALLKQHGDRITEMERWNVPFERDSSGQLYTAADRRGKVHRNIFVLGTAMMQRMKAHALNKGVDFAEKIMVTDLLTSDGQHPTNGKVTGALGFHIRTGQLHVFRAKAVIISTGPTGSAKLYTSSVDNLTGDGQAIAYRAGAELSGMEFVMMPKFPLWERKFFGLAPSVFAQYKAKIINNAGETILEKYFPGQNIQTLGRVEISYAMAKEALEGRGPICFDMTHWSDESIEQIRSVMPRRMRAVDEIGIDLRKEPLESMPMLSVMGGYGQGGIRIDDSWKSSIPGLYAAGSAAHAPMNYADIGGLGQAICYFSGYRSGEEAAKTALGLDSVEIDRKQAELLRQEMVLPLARTSGPSPDSIFLAINRVTVPAQLSFFKHERRIRTTLAEMRRIQKEEIPRVRAKDIHDLAKANEARNITTAVEVIYRSALERKESRLTHYREDFPYRDDIDWLKWVIVRKDRREGMAVRFEPIPIDEYPIKPAQRLRIPAPIQFSWSTREGSE